MREYDIMRLKNEGHRWFISGVIYYNDVFPNSDRHVTKYCYYVDMWPYNSPDSHPVFEPCEKWNCTDSEC
jgi:hypothetical protein